MLKIVIASGSQHLTGITDCDFVYEFNEAREIDENVQKRRY